MSKNLRSIFIFDNGNVAVFDFEGQVAELQNNVACEIAKKAEQLGYNIDGETILLNDEPVRFFRIGNDDDSQETEFNFERV